MSVSLDNHRVLYEVLMVQIAWKMLLHRPARFLLTMVGVGVSFFLSTSQLGLLVGWCNMNSAIIRHARADVWVMAPHTPAFDFGTAIPRHRIYQVRSTEGVAWAEGLFTTWSYLQRPDGKRVNIELVGLDESSVAGPWVMYAGEVEAVHRPETILIDEIYRSAMGVDHIGQEVEVMGHRAVVGGFSQGVRAFTASPYVFTSIETALRYDPRFQDDEICYVLARCAPGYSPERLRDAIARNVSDVEVLTGHQFAVRTIKYWMLETGAGITVVVTAILGLIVGSFITSQTLYTITQDHISNYATLAALGFSRSQLTGVVMLQSLVLGLGGVVLGAAGFFLASRASAATQIPIETTSTVFCGLVGLSLACGVMASFASIRSIFQIDPISVFRV
jgi:putative ABC transport system permease protein